MEEANNSTTKVVLIGVRQVVGKALMVLLLLLIATGCFWGDEYETRHLTEHYYLSEVEPNSGLWQLHFEDEEFGLADALLSSQVVEAGFNKHCIILRAVGSEFYIIPLSDTKDREVARRSVVGPLKINEFQATVRRISGNDVPRVDPALTKTD